VQGHPPFLEKSVEKNILKKGISGATLKWIAVITMIIDHFGASLYCLLPNWSYGTYDILRNIGRISFPIYCFLLVEGFFHTRNVKKYILNCLIFALISEIPFDMAMHGKPVYIYSQNIYFTLGLGLVALYVLDKFKYKYDIKYILARLVTIAVFAGLGQVLEVDYHWKGILFIIMFYYCHDIEKWRRNIIGIAAFSYEITAPLAFIPIQLYNGERGKQNKYMFYVIYPLHLLIYGIIRIFLETGLK
jgi:hypothetical protein